MFEPSEATTTHTQRTRRTRIRGHGPIHCVRTIAEALKREPEPGFDEIYNSGGGGGGARRREKVNDLLEVSFDHYVYETHSGGGNCGGRSMTDGVVYGFYELRLRMTPNEVAIWCSTAQVGLQLEVGAHKLNHKDNWDEFMAFDCFQ
ncbi:hypothetical protein RP20_CCG021833 [Aedes albopictus]|nr:hypothetical protein RP20_CCG021833 [Aedes albopictus]